MVTVRADSRRRGRTKEREMTVLLIAIAAGVATTIGFGALLYHDSRQARQMVQDAGRRTS